MAAELGVIPASPEPVDLAPAPAVEGVLETEVVERPPYRCPLDVDPATGEYPTVLRGGRLTDLLEVEHVRVRAAYGRLRWWRKLASRRPAGYRAGWW